LVGGDFKDERRRETFTRYKGTKWCIVPREEWVLSAGVEPGV
jgi:hypothetical protein